MYSIRAFFVLQLVLAMHQGAFAQTEFSYQPPVIPIALTVDSDGLRIVATNQCVTPLGTFAVGTGSAAVRNSKTSYFVVRKGDKETVFCVGTPGRLRLKTEGRHVIDIGKKPGNGNVFQVDLMSSTGSIDVEFVPDTAANELATFYSPGGDVVKHVLKTDGSIVYDDYVDTVYRPDQITGIHVADIPEAGSAAVTISYKQDNGTTGQYFVPCKGEQRYAVLWFADCVKFLYAHKLTMPKVAGGYLRVPGTLTSDFVWVFEDGAMAETRYFHLPAESLVRQVIPRSSFKFLSQASTAVLICQGENCSPYDSAESKDVTVANEGTGSQTLTFPDAKVAAEFVAAVRQRSKGGMP